MDEQPTASDVMPEVRVDLFAKSVAIAKSNEVGVVRTALIAPGDVKKVGVAVSVDVRDDAKRCSSERERKAHIKPGGQPTTVH